MLPACVMTELLYEVLQSDATNGLTELVDHFSMMFANARAVHSDAAEDSFSWGDIDHLVSRASMTRYTTILTTNSTYLGEQPNFLLHAQWCYTCVTASLKLALAELVEPPDVLTIAIVEMFADLSGQTLFWALDDEVEAEIADGVPDDDDDEDARSDYIAYETDAPDEDDDDVIDDLADSDSSATMPMQSEYNIDDDVEHDDSVE